MAHIVVLGAGLGGTIMAYEAKEHLGPAHQVTVINNGSKYSFVPSNPWVAVGWRTADEIEVDLTKVMSKRNITLRPEGAKRIHPDENRVELNNGEDISYDYLVIATGPELAFDEIEGLGPEGFTQSVCQTDHAVAAKSVFDELVANPRPVVIGAVQGASCFGPAYEFAFILETALRKAKVRDKVPMTFVTSEPYIGHLGLDGVGDTKGMIESAMRDRHIKWITNSKVKSVEDGMMHVEEVNEDGSTKKEHDLPFGLSMMLPAFRGVDAVKDIEGLTNPRGFIIVDEHQQNPKYKNIFGIGVGIAIPPMGPTPVPVGVPKTGFMIESMVTATAKNLHAVITGKEPHERGTWNAICLADFGDGGIAFVAQPQLPPRNVNWSSDGKWVHYAKIGFEKYFLRKIKVGKSEPFYERLAMQAMGIDKLRQSQHD